MPYINKPKKKHKGKVGINKDISKLYNSSMWKQLRNGYIIQHPICEICLKEYEEGNRLIEEVMSTEEIHHIIPISNGRTKMEMEQLAFDAENLKALCRFHHHKIHNLK